MDNNWPPAVMEVSYEYASVRPSVRNARSQNCLISFFLIFSMKLGGNEIKMWGRPYFEKTFRRVRRAQNVLKLTQKWGFWSFDINLINSYVLFLFEYKSANGLLTFFKDYICGKNLVHELWSKILQTNQIARFFKLECLTNELRRKVKFCV